MAPEMVEISCACWWDEFGNHLRLSTAGEGVAVQIDVMPGDDSYRQSSILASLIDAIPGIVAHHAQEHDG